MQFRLESEGFKATLCTDGQRALDMNLRAFTLIVVDLMGTDFDGIQFTRAVKRSPDTYHIPVIVLSSRSTEDSIPSQQQ